MSMINVPCRCGRMLKVAEELAGKSCKCSKCGERVNVPGIVGTPKAKKSLPPPRPAANAEPDSDKVVVRAELNCPACNHHFAKSFSRPKQQTLCPECNATLLVQLDLAAETVQSVEFLEAGMKTTRRGGSGPIDTGGRGALRVGLRLLSRALTTLAILFAGVGFPSLGITLGMAFCLTVGTNPADMEESLIVAGGIGCLMVAMTVITYTYYHADEHVLSVTMFFLGSTAYVGSGFLSRFSMVLAFIGLVILALVALICLLLLLVGLICTLLGARGDREWSCVGGALLAALGTNAMLVYGVLLQPSVPVRAIDLTNTTSPQTSIAIVLAGVLGAAAHPLFVLFLANVARRFGSPETADAVKTYFWYVLGLTGFTILLVLLAAVVRPPPALVLLVTAVLIVTEVLRQFWSIWIINTVHDLIYV